MIQITVAICFMTFTAGITQRIISPQLSELQNLCPGDEVNIICETRGSSVMAWSSDEYIGLGSLLEIRIVDNIGDRCTSSVNPNTIATLINNTVEDGVQVLVSQLHIRVLSQLMSSSVTCINVALGTQTIARLHVLGMFQHRWLQARAYLGSARVDLAACDKNVA